MINRLLLWLLCCYPCLIYAQSPLVLDTTNNYYLISGEHLTFIEDKQQQWNADNIQQAQDQQLFKRLPSNNPNFGYSNSGYWFHFRLKRSNNVSSQWLLEVDYPLLDYVSLIVGDTHYQTGDHLSFDSRSIKHHNFIFPVALDNDLTDCYLYIKSSGSVGFSLSITQPNQFIENTNYNSLWQGIYYGVIIALIIYNLFLFISIKDVAYGYYILFMSSYFMALFSMNGYAFQYLWPNSPAIAEYSLLVLLYMTVIFGILFSRHFLRSYEISKRCDHWILRFTVSIGLLLAIAILFLDYSTSIRLFTAIVLLAVAVMLIFATKCMLEGNRSARYYLLAWGGLFIGVVIVALKNFGLLPVNFFTQWGLHIGSCAEALLLSFGLGDRINRMNHEKEVAKQANEAKSLYLAMIGHEIRTPINGILGITQLLKQTTLSQQQQKFAETIQQSGENLSTLVNDLMDFSKIEAGKMQLEQASFCLKDCIDEVFNLLKPNAEAKQLTLSYQLSADIPQCIVGDALRLQQVLTNLISNAIKFTHYGEVNLLITNTKLDQSLTLLFSVKDTGIGISEQRLNTLFSSLYQTDVATTKQYGGTGLGLNICQQLVKLMQGHIWVESTIGVGSTFHFTLLTKQGEMTEPKVVEPVAKVEQVLRMLLVEDNEVNQFLAESFLTNLGHQVEVVNDGFEAIEIIKHQIFDIIFMDMHMPGIDGLETTQKMMQLSNLPKPLYIIAMTADITSDMRDRCQQVGMQDYMSKPIDTNSIVTVLQRWQQSLLR